MDIVEQVKESNRIEDVIPEVTPLQRKHGRYLRGKEHDSLVVDTRTQTYSWNSKNEIRGDVIEWLMQRHGWDFKSTVEWLAQRAHLPEPKWSQEESSKRVARRKRESVFAVAQSVFQRWLFDDEKALDYCKHRGWSEETIRESGVGFSGRFSAAEIKDMRGEFAMHEIDPGQPNAVAILGYKGDVSEWGNKLNLEPFENWVEWGMVPGLMGKTRLIYAHIANGRVKTFSARNILGAETNKEGKEIKSYNLPVLLAGRRQAYANHIYGSRAEECVIVEGQADAITLGQWGIPAVALAGTSWRDHAILLKELRKRHKKLYVGMDADEAGYQALMGRDKDWPMAQILGPMARLVRWGA